ncbi:MAG: hypothetical protein R3298_02955 [Gammaproteobacteria bacterium]|nr:hypothetical protein [Gammaproteobacteria bacterium]
MDDWSFQGAEEVRPVAAGQDDRAGGHHDRRNIIERTQSQLRRALTEQQLMTINTYLSFGWKFFVRGAKTSTPVAFIVSPDVNEVIVIDEDGDVVHDHDIVYRA